jgi:hypothetical protein
VRVKTGNEVREGRRRGKGQRGDKKKVWRMREIEEQMER